MVYLISQADLVIIPTQGSELDANEASRAIRVVMQSQKMTKTDTPYAVLLTRINPSIRTRTQAHIQNGLIDAGIPVFETEINERDAFKAVFSFQQTLDGLNAADVPNLDKAKLNVWEFVHEVIARLKTQVGDREELQDENSRRCRCRMNERVNPFAILTEQPPAFTPKAKPEKPEPKEAIEKIAEANNFPSRQAAKTAPVRRKQRRFRTGRDQHLGIKATAETRERFHKVADERNVPLGELLRMALDALEAGRGRVTGSRV